MQIFAGGGQIFFIYSDDYMFCNTYNGVKRTRVCLLFTTVKTLNDRSCIHFA